MQYTINTTTTLRRPNQIPVLTRRDISYDQPGNRIIHKQASCRVVTRWDSTLIPQLQPAYYGGTLARTDKTSATGKITLVALRFYNFSITGTGSRNELWAPSRSARSGSYLFLQQPRGSTMAPKSQRRNGRDSVLSARLDTDIQVLDLAKDTCGVPPAQVAFSSAGALLVMIRVRPPLLFTPDELRIHTD